MTARNKIWFTLKYFGLRHSTEWELLNKDFKKMWKFNYKGNIGLSCLPSLLFASLSLLAPVMSTRSIKPFHENTCAHKRIKRNHSYSSVFHGGPINTFVNTNYDVRQALSNTAGLWHAWGQKKDEEEKRHQQQLLRILKQ